MPSRQFRVALARAYPRKGLGTVLARKLVKLATNAGSEKMVASIVDNQVNVGLIGGVAARVEKGNFPTPEGSFREFSEFNQTRPLSRFVRRAAGC